MATSYNFTVERKDCEMRIQFYNTEKGFGYGVVTLDDRDLKTFIHRRDVGCLRLQPRQHVICDLARNAKGFIAKNLKPLQQSSNVESDLRGMVISFDRVKNQGLLKNHLYNIIKFMGVDVIGSRLPSAQDIVSFDLARRDGLQAVNVAVLGEETSSPAPSVLFRDEFGFVKKFIAEKYYGFIRSGNREVFFHMRHVIGQKKPEVGQRVRLNIVSGKKGLFEASDVRLLGGPKESLTPSAASSRASSPTSSRPPDLTFEKERERLRNLCLDVRVPDPVPDFTRGPDPVANPTRGPDPVPDPARGPDPVPDPARVRLRYPFANPTRLPDPVPDPVRGRNPVPDSTRGPDPVPDSTRGPDPVPDPARVRLRYPFANPTRGPDPMPDPARGPDPVPDPARVRLRYPFANPTRGPDPVPDPTRGRNPVPDPARGPDPVPHHFLTGGMLPEDAQRMRETARGHEGRGQRQRPPDTSRQRQRTPDTSPPTPAERERPERSRYSACPRSLVAHPMSGGLTRSDSRDSPSDSAPTVVARRSKHQSSAGGPELRPESASPAAPEPQAQAPAPLYSSQQDPTRLDETRECPVCKKKLTWPLRTPCNHHFCRACIERWLKFQPQCPCCPKKTLDVMQLEAAP